MKEITPIELYSEVCDERRDAVAEVLATEYQHTVVTDLAVLPQQISQDPALADLLHLIPVPPRILLQVVDCESTQNVLKNFLKNAASTKMPIKLKTI